MAAERGDLPLVETLLANPSVRLMEVDGAANPDPDPDPVPSPVQEKLKAEQEAAMQQAMEDAKRAAEEQARSLAITPSSSRPRSR